MKTSRIIPILIVGASLRAFAQAPQGPPPDPLGMTLDKNHDHEFSASEIKAATRALLKLDKDRSNSLSTEELRPEPPKGQGQRKSDRQNGQNGPHDGPPPSKLMEALDNDSSGDLSAAEITAASKALLALDTDGDGKLSPTEAGIPEFPGPRNGAGGRPPGGGGGPPPPPGGAR
jgi:EF hand